MCPIPEPNETSTDGEDKSSVDSSHNCQAAAAAAATKKFPSDWPGPGPIDLDRHDLPHFSSSCEWWYLHAHLDIVNDDQKKKKKKKPDNKKKPSSENEKQDNDDEKHHGVSLFASFFRRGIDHDKTAKEYVFSHAVSWAVMDHKTEKYYNVSLVDRSIPGLFVKWIQDDRIGPTVLRDARLRKALMEMLSKGVVPYPDRLLTKDALIMGKNLSRIPDQNNQDEKRGIDNQLWKIFVNSFEQEDDDDDESEKKHNKAVVVGKEKETLKELTLEEKKAFHEKNKKTKKKKKKKEKSGGGSKSSCCCFKNILNSVVPNTIMPRLTLDYDGNTFIKNVDGSYDLYLEDNEVHHVKVKLNFMPHTEAIRNGMDGFIDGEGILEDFFYYCLPHCTVTGSVTLPEDEKLNTDDAKILPKSYFVLEGDEEDSIDKSQAATTKTHTHKVTGTGWYDHQFGTMQEGEDSLERKSNVDASYTWLSLQMDNGYQLCCSEVTFHRENCVQAWANDKPKRFAIMVAPDGQTVHKLAASDFTFTETGEHWISMSTFRSYPVHWEVAVPSFDIQLKVAAVFPKQEFATIISHPAFWEGCVKATGSFGGKSITGKGVVERRGFAPRDTHTLEYFFKSVCKETLKSVHKILPFEPQGDKLNELVSRKENAHYTEFIDSKEYSKALVEPIRSVLDRGGKSWRSYAALACCEIVGGNSQEVQDWLALPELMHVGSCIVDDVEDRSTIRRGEPCCHVLYGEDVAINAGTTAYFLGQTVIYHGDGDAQTKVDLYNLYFEAMRAAHSGQAMDIHGLDYMMPDVVEHGGDLCRQRVIAIHRLKTAVPASSLAGMGCKLGGGSKAQSRGLANYFEALGIGFQIVDDVLNLRGFTDGLKTRGEDITAGKVTYPVAVAMSRLEKDDRARLWEIISSKPEDNEIVKEAIALIDKVDGNEVSLKHATEIIEEGWRKLDPLVRDSMVKVNLRAFSLYVLDKGENAIH